MKVIILGGVAAGTKVAAKLKREDRSCEVTILTKGKDISYAGCGLPYYVGGLIETREDLIVNTPESFSGLTGVEVQTEREAIGLDRAAKTVQIRDLQTGETETHSYDKLVIATGASPVKPPLPGLDLPGVFFMRTPDDAIALRKALEAGEVKRAVIAGGGLIGLEVAENLKARGVRVSVIDMADQVLPGFDPEFAEYVENHLSDEGIVSFTGTALQGAIGEDHVEKVQTSRRAMKADTLILSVGIRPNTAFLADTGLDMFKGTLKVNEYMQTNDEDIYAVGDCAMVTNRVTGEGQWSPMGSSANHEGRVCAMHIAGKKHPYRGVFGTSVAKLPGLNVGRTGMTETGAKAAGLDAVSVVAVVDDKAHYFPGASTFIVKMTAERGTKRFLGIQVLGTGAVDKMVDIGVTALAAEATLDDLESVDYAYAPPFSTAIHPFSHVVNVLLNKMDGMLTSISPAEYRAGAAEGYRVLDTSIQPAIPGATYIDLAKVNGPLAEAAPDEKLLLVCSKGKRAYMLQNRLKYFGYTNTLVLEGGLGFNEVEV
ncbi:MAG: FAD-dependent oxidoreductase [Lachnospiraceae bacterium]|nr:FAD-dependent oxidoreductase [Lachnospiraceae bacterium]